MSELKLQFRFCMTLLFLAPVFLWGLTELVIENPGNSLNSDRNQPLPFSGSKDQRLGLPNIILIMVDDLGVRALEREYTPTLDHLRDSGIRLTHTYSMPLCTPSRVQIMTGLYNNRNYVGFGTLKVGETTFAHILKSSRYRTCITGKWQLGGDAYSPYKFGFDEYCLWQLSSKGYHERYHNPKVITNGTVRKFRNGEYGPRVFADYTLNFMERNSEGPFFIYYPMALTHRPHVPTPDSADYSSLFDGSFRGKSDSQYFHDQVRYMDRIVGEIVNKTYELGIEKNTLILFTTDNGTGNELTVELNAKPVQGQKGKTNVLATHVPTFAFWPGVIMPGTEYDGLVDFSDFLPTIADAAQIQLPDSFKCDGISFFPHLKGSRAPERQWVYCYYDSGKEQFPKREFVHNHKWKLYSDGKIFDIEDDPLETKPLTEKEFAQTDGEARSQFLKVFEMMQQASN